MRHPSKYDGLHVLVRGYLFTDYREFNGVSDRACPKRFLPFGVIGHAPAGNAELEGAIELAKDKSRAVHAQIAS